MKICDLFESTVSTYLSSVQKIDQTERRNYASFVKANGGDYEKGAKLYAQKYNRSSDDIFGEKKRNSAFIAKAQKFDFANFSKDDWNNFWLICQHCDFDRNFQKWALIVIKKFLGPDNNHYKYLYDRISCALYGKQKYGTQDICGN